MKQGKTDITILLDRSGSMQSIKADTIGGFNAFLKSQRETPGEAVLSLVQFDTYYEPNYTAVNIHNVPALDELSFMPRGGTALYDAICKAIDTTGERLSITPESERPALVVFVIQTDGEENSSREFNADHVRERITHQKDVYKWQFIFLGANQDAILTARTMGIDMSKSISYAASAEGVSNVSGYVASNLSMARGMVNMGLSASVAGAALDFSEAQYNAADDEIDKFGGMKNATK